MAVLVTSTIAMKQTNRSKAQLEAAERKAYLLEQSNLWIAAVAFNGTASDYGSLYGLVEAAHDAVEEGR